MFDQQPAELVLGIPRRSEYRIDAARVDMSRRGGAARLATLAALPQDALIDLGKSAVIVIDMQNDFCSEGGWVSSLGVDLSGARALFDPLNAVLRAARAQSVPVLWVSWGVRADRANLSPGTLYTFSDKQSFVGLGSPLAATGGRSTPHRLLVEDEWGAAIVDELEQDPSDIHVAKHRISGFWDTPLDSILRNLQVSTLFLAGVNSDHCVLGTLMDANFKGYDTFMLEDCAATTSPDFCHRAAIHNVRFCFGFTTTSAEFVAGLGEKDATTA